MESRTAARVVLLDEADRVMLLEGIDQTGRWWFTPGGGREPGEPADVTAIREVREETGVHLDRVVGPIYDETIELPIDGVMTRQRQDYFAARVTAAQLAAATATEFTEIERRVIQRARWWTLAELAATADRVYPDVIIELAQRAARMLETLATPATT